MNQSRLDEESSLPDSNIRSPRLPPQPNSQVPKRKLLGCMQSAQEIPRMHLFNDILTKVMTNNHTKQMRMALVAI